MARVLSWRRVGRVVVGSRDMSAVWQGVELPLREGIGSD